MEGISSISGVKPIDFFTVHKVLTSNDISDSQKAKFIKNNRSLINEMVENKISSSDFKSLMENRPLKLFKPIKNSYTKRGDKIILAQTLGIKSCDVDNFVKKVATQLMMADPKLSFLPEDQIDTVKTYVYRHGTKEQVLAFLDYELGNAKSILKTLYSTLSYNTGGLADYFYRPIHHMDNKTLINVYNVINKNLHIAQEKGYITNSSRANAAEDALIQIYYIQNNQRLRNAIKIYRAIS